jgi:hypothetical protein
MIVVDVQLYAEPYIPPSPKLYRVKTDREIIEQQIAVPGHGQFWEPGRGVNWRQDLPMVFWLFDGSRVPFDYAQQLLAFDMVKEVMSASKFSKLYRYDKAFTNNTGFEQPGDPRVNYITGENIGAPVPEWDKIRVCGNAELKGVETYSVMQTLRDTYALMLRTVTAPRSLAGNMKKSISLLVTNNMLIVDTIDPNNVPTWEELKPKTWLYFEAVSSNRYGDAVPFPQGGGEPVLIPLIASTVVRFPLSALELV